MMSLFKAELRKIYTIRTTYFFTVVLGLIAMLIFAFYVEGFKAGTNGAPVTDHAKLANLLLDAVSNMAFWGGIVAILSLTHEYRYNTITYTLTAARSRSKSLLAKIMSLSVFAVCFTLFLVVVSTALLYLGLAIKGFHLSPQVLHVDLIWRLLFIGWAQIMLALLLATLIRQQVGALVGYLVIPSIVEQLFSLVLKDNKIYLPFTALQQVAHFTDGSVHHPLSHAHAAFVVGIYLVIGWVIAWILFLRRDATI
jgi:ABC-type transport system involved in multi-copper enzyme maturation permease subunit